MSTIEQTILSIATGAQLIGGSILVLCIVVCGIKMSAGGEEGLRSGKKWLIGIVIGAICIFGATGIKEWLRSKIVTGSLNSTIQIAITTVQRYLA